ncbi:MAG: aromatic aminobenezylarsenical efflux permease ArsG family transporter [Chloroflexota bacterium]
MNPIGGVQDMLAGSGVPLFSAFLLGLLVAVSPCPLSTNLAALAYIGRGAAEPGQVLYFGACYTVGRMVSYSALTALLVLVGLEVSRVATLLQDAGQYLVGPLLVIAGLVSLGLLPLRLPSALGARVGLGQRLAEAGPAGAFGLGALFALAFCPYSATLFFGALLPLALGPAGGLVLAPAFAVGTGLPVLVAAFLLSAGVAGLARWFEATARLERWLRRLMGLLFLIAGLYAMSAWLALWS